MIWLKRLLVEASKEYVSFCAPKDTLRVDDEEATERDTRVLDQHAVVARNLHAAVGDEGDLEVGAKAAGLALELRPCKVRVLRVGGEA